MEVIMPTEPKISGRKTGDKPPRKSEKSDEPATIAAPKTIVPIIDPT